MLAEIWWSFDIQYPVDPRQIFVKRVVGIGGDRVHITARVLYRNGQALREPYVLHKFPMMHEYGDNCPGDTKVPPVSLGPGVIEHGGEMLRDHVVDGEIDIPAGSYFVLGDNRDNSLDSRYWGFLTDKDVIGKPFLIYDSRVPATSGETAANPFRARKRWNRLLKLL